MLFINVIIIIIIIDVFIVIIIIFFKDLSHYEYDKMVTKSMMLLNRYYSSYDNLFTRAVQAQVLY